jgi:Flp pilus assembly pilin Flp
MKQQSPPTHNHTHQAGVTTAEYALMLGLVGVVGILGLKTFGGSTHQLIAGSGSGLATNNTMNVLAPIPSSLGTPLNGGGYYAFAKDPVTGQMALQLVDGSQGVAANVTSIDGNRNTLGTLMIANRLYQLAQQENDPVLKDYYAQLAEISYYLGGAEGELDDVPELDQNIDIYNNGQALKDVLDFGKKLETLLNNPPNGFKNSDAFNEIMPLAVEVYNIAQSYKNTLSEYITPEGPVLSFGGGVHSVSGNGKPGSALNNNTLDAGGIVAGKRATTSYQDIVPYDQMRKKAAVVLSDHKVESAPVESTLTDATAIYTEATAP